MNTKHGVVALILAVSCMAHAQQMQQFMFRMVSADGKPMSSREIRQFHALDMNDEPIPTRAAEAQGFVTVIPPVKPFQVSTLLKVPGFGEVIVFADNRGKGYSKPGVVDFAMEAAATRLLRVNSAVEAARKEGVQIPAESALKLGTAKTKPPYESLAITLAAGEEITLLRAKNRISQLKAPRKDFLFGCNSFGHPSRGPMYDERFKAIFNWGTTNLYMSYYAPTETTRDFAQCDLETDWLRSFGAAVKPCPPIYFGASVTPQWMRNRPYSEVSKFCHDLVAEVCKRYAGKAKFCEIVNEAHDMANSLDLTPAQLTDLANVNSKAAREGDPKVLRIINSCHVWGDYAAIPARTGPNKRSPYKYLQDCIKAGVQFEIVGLQMYYPDYDLLEVDRMLEKYARLGKPIIITELGCQSAPGIDPNAIRKKPIGEWHGPWTEEIQADWVEGVYTIFYSKPYVQGASWWDLADNVSFWPFGGLCRGDLSPKPSYDRLLGLEKKWGVRK